jgi:hypothetical protein
MTRRGDGNFDRTVSAPTVELANAADRGSLRSLRRLIRRVRRMNHQRAVAIGFGPCERPAELDAGQ